MKRYRLPPGTEPGKMPMAIVEHRDPVLTHMYGMLHAALVLHDAPGPFELEQLLQLFPTQRGLDKEEAAQALQRLAELGYIEVDYLV